MGLQIRRRYRDRREAGRILAENIPDRLRAATLVFAIPGGGVPVGFEVAQELDAPLDVIVVRKLGHPWQPELAIGAIAPGGVRLVDPEFGLPDAVIDAIASREMKEMKRRERVYRERNLPLDPATKTAIIVDDGLATGYTMRAAIASLRNRRAQRIVVAVPVGARPTCDALTPECDELVCPLQPVELGGVGSWYENFDQTGDEEVQMLLRLAQAARLSETGTCRRDGAGNRRMFAALSGGGPDGPRDQD